MRTGLILIAAVLTLPVLAFECESPNSCSMCLTPQTWLPAQCTDVIYDAFCSCQNNPVIWLDCKVWDSCDYTGPPACANPLPSGECPDEVTWRPGPGDSLTRESVKQTLEPNPKGAVVAIGSENDRRREE